MMPDGSWIRVEKLPELLENFKPIIYHPDDPRYRGHWQQLRKKLIEGIWVEQFGKQRFMSGRLGFYGNFFMFTEWNPIEKTRIVGRPDIRDLEWHRSYYRMEMDGFSGWEGDDEYTSDRIIEDIDKGLNIHPTRLAALYNSKGSLKKFKEPRVNLFELHDFIKGKPLYFNEARNHVELGSRGSGKSYWEAGGEILFDLVFHNRKYYNIGEPNSSIAELEVTSAGGGKATELLEKVKQGMDFLADPEFPDLGVYTYENGSVEPCPFWKEMRGDITANNKENRYRATKKINRDGRWEETKWKGYIINTSYSVNTKGGGRKSAGGRRTKVTHEEAGENILLLDSWGSNEGMVAESGYKLASQKAIGTSGDMETIEPVKKIFTNPSSYKCLEFIYPDYPEDKHGFFIPVYISDPRFKDENGNTRLAEALDYHKGEIQKKIDKGDPPDVIINHKVNYPIRIEDMWYSTHGNILPVLEAEQREKELMKGGLYKSIGTNIELFFDTNADNGVGYKIKTDANPFYNFPFDTDHKGDLEGCVRMFIHPNKLMINGQIPKDAVLTLIDPYVAGEWDKGGSLGAIICIVNPKYTSYGLPGNCLAASFYGKPLGGVEKFGEISVLIHSFYGNCHNTVWYEAVRGGDTIRNAFIKRNRFLCLAHRPQFENGHWLIPTKTTQTGYIITGGNKGLGKRTLWTELNDWLLLEQELTIDGVTETKRVIERIPDIFLIRQIKEAKMDGLNVDAVSALQPISVALGEQEMKMKIKGNQSGHLAAIQNYMIKKYKK